MADQKKKLNKKALAGFLLAILSPVLAAEMMAALGSSLYRRFPYPQVYFGILIVSAILFPLLGRIFSVIGLIMSIVKKQKGKGLAIAGIILTELEFIVYFAICIFELIIALCGDVRHSP